MACTYEELRKAKDVLSDIEHHLHAEQGGLCAYTGRSISLSPKNKSNYVGFHLEHLTPQSYCDPGQDADLSNLVACYPEPNTPQAPYGAHPKADWPSTAERHLLLSPLDPSCASRLRFRSNGVVEPANTQDRPALETIQNLFLNHPELTALRRAAIQTTLSPKFNQKLTKQQTSTLLQKMRQDEEDLARGLSVSLKPYCFALVQVLEKHLRSFG